jgi:hypothetical protein
MEDMEPLRQLIVKTFGESKLGVLRTYVFLHHEKLTKKTIDKMFLILSSSSPMSLLLTLKESVGNIKLRLFRAGNDSRSSTIAGDGLCGIRTAIVMQKRVTSGTWQADLDLSKARDYHEVETWLRNLARNLLASPDLFMSERTLRCVEGCLSFLIDNADRFRTSSLVFPQDLWLPTDSHVLISAQLGIRYTCFIRSTELKMTTLGRLNNLQWYEARDIGNIFAYCLYLINLKFTSLFLCIGNGISAENGDFSSGKPYKYIMDHVVSAPTAYCGYSGCHFFPMDSPHDEVLEFEQSVKDLSTKLFKVLTPFRRSLQHIIDDRSKGINSNQVEIPQLSAFGEQRRMNMLRNDDFLKDILSSSNPLASKKQRLGNIPDITFSII